MPIRPENRARYPANWRQISLRIRERAGGRCECEGECGRGHFTAAALANMARDGIPAGDRCAARHGENHPVTGSRVVLTVAHLDHEPEHCDDENLKAMCQRCHLAYDQQHHAETAAATRRAKKASGDLFVVNNKTDREIFPNP